MTQKEKEGLLLVIVGDPGAVSGAGEKSKRARKKFGLRKVKKGKKSGPTNCPWVSEDAS